MQRACFSAARAAATAPHTYKVHASWDFFSREWEVVRKRLQISHNIQALEPELRDPRTRAVAAQKLQELEAAFPPGDNRPLQEQIKALRERTSSN